jgi:hypothetical protein
VIHVPTFKVGYLIGHCGRTIWGFEKTTGAKIDILKPNSSEQVLFITSVAECICPRIIFFVEIKYFFRRRP